jgi:NhaA family Na+:H+ antiporter
LTARALVTLERFLHVEAASGFALLGAAGIALVWANSPVADSYHEIWRLPLSINLGRLAVSQSLHFWINDGLMTVFFLIVGMEVRRELHDGALSDPRQAALPVVAAVGGVVVPALIYLGLNAGPVRGQGWAVPTATDIAFAVGVLALLGRSIPANVRIFLLALAIIDDVIAVLIIAVFYAGGLGLDGLMVAALGLLLVLGLQRLAVDSAYAYVLPGGVVWIGLLMSGAHPTLAGVMLGLMTPVRAMPVRLVPSTTAARRSTRPPLPPPVVRVQAALHPWVAYGAMPLFAFANAGVTFGGVDLSAHGAQLVMLGVALALVVGKPAGVIGFAWLMVRLRWSRLPSDVSWGGMGLIGILAGIGFTMSIFMAMLAFADENLLGAAKLGVLLGSLMAALLGLGWGARYGRRLGKPT